MSNYFTKNTNECLDFEEYLDKYHNQLSAGYEKYLAEYGGPEHLRKSEIVWCSDCWKTYLAERD